MTDQQNAALLPCPFCGGEAEIHEHASGMFVSVGCKSVTCDVEGPLGGDVAEAIAAWNTRPAPAGAEAVREAYAIGALAMAHYYHGDYAEDEFKGDHAGRAMRPEHIEWAKANAHVLPAALAKAPSTGEAQK